jgi:hypothetical protein
VASTYGHLVLRGDNSYLVECYVPGIRQADVESAAGRVAAASADLRDDGMSIEYGGAILVPGDEVVLHLFNSRSEEVVRQASERAALPFERILATVAFDGGHV